jgi:hypothetical protein
MNGMTPEETMAAKRAIEKAHAKAMGVGKSRSGVTKPGQQPRDKAKAKASRDARKRNR